MEKKNVYYIGRMAKTHGYKGGLSIKIDSGPPETYRQLKSVFIEVNDNLTPFFLESVDVGGKGKLFVRIEGINSIDEAKPLVGKFVYLSKEMRPELDDGEFYPDEVEGFAVVDTNHGNLGKVKEVLTYPNQLMLKVMHDGIELLIPANKHILKRVDKNRKELLVETPEGLIDLYS